MKKIYYILFIALAFILTSCHKEPKPVSAEEIIGTWTLEHFGGVPAGELSIWIDFQSSSFDIYQRASSDVSYEHFTGEWTITAGVLSGKYSDGTSWASSYNAEISEDGKLVLVSSSTEEESIYRKADFPSGFQNQVRPE